MNICIVIVHCVILFFKQGDVSELKGAVSELEGAGKFLEEVKM